MSTDLSIQMRAIISQSFNGATRGLVSPKSKGLGDLEDCTDLAVTGVCRGRHHVDAARHNVNSAKRSSRGRLQ
jgi:hypothetical protein